MTFCGPGVTALRDGWLNAVMVMAAGFCASAGGFSLTIVPPMPLVRALSWFQGERGMGRGESAFQRGHTPLGAAALAVSGENARLKRTLVRLPFGVILSNLITWQPRPPGSLCAGFVCVIPLVLTGVPGVGFV